MTGNLFSFNADYRDGRVYVGGKVYATGLFATHLLNRFYLNDTAARIAVFSDDVNFNIVRQLENGYLNISEFVKTGKNVLEALKALPKLHPFDMLNNSAVIAFVLTDFFEGLHYGHYPRRCGICKKYFLMQSARRQQYCMGIAPKQIRGQNVSCRKYAASMKRKEKAENDPISAIYTNRCSAIRTEVKRGTIPAELGEVAKALALEHKKTAMMDDDYAKKQYKKDMFREKLYKDAGLK